MIKLFSDSYDLERDVSKKPLTLYHTILTFNDPQKETF